MPKIALTDRFCAAAKPPEGGEVEFFDTKETGLALRCKGASRTWRFHFTAPRDGKRAQVKLGTYPATSLAAARGKAIEARGYLEETPARDPRTVMVEDRAGAMTVATLIPLYLDKPHKRTGRPRKSAPEIRRRLMRNAVPVIGSVKLADLHRRDVNRVVQPMIARNTPAEAARTFEDLRGLIRWGVSQGYLDHNPVDGMERPAASGARERALSDEELQALWTGLPLALPRSKDCQRIIKLCLVTAQRVGEVAGMSLEELDLKAGTWTIPASRTKNGSAHAVPLSSLAVQIIQEAREAVGEGARFLFPNAGGNGPLPAAAVARTILRAHESDGERPKGRFDIDHWTAHDLRRTAVSNMAKLGVAPIVLGHVINHRSVTKAGVTLSVYSQYDYAREKRAALDLWAERLDAIVRGGAEVVQIGSRR